MRTHTKLSDDQISTNKTFNGLPPAMRHLARRHYTKKVMTDLVREMNKDQRAGLTLAAAVEAIDAARTWLSSSASNSRPFKNVDYAPKPYTEHLMAIREKSIIGAAKQVVKYGATGGTDWNVLYDATACYATDRGKDWNTYSKRTKFPAIVDIHNIVVPQDWRLRVRPIGDGDGVVDDAMILDAVLDVGDHYGRVVYRVRVARAGRGYNVTVTDEYASCWPGGHVSLYKRYDHALAEPVPDGVWHQPSSADLDVLATFA